MSNNLSWDPKKSDLVEQTISEVVELISAGSLPRELNPAALVANGSETLRKLYYSSFRRVDSPEWAKERFKRTESDPSGFASFVSEVNVRLGESVVSIKRNVPMYYSHTHSELRTILEFREEYLQSESTREEFLDRLRAEHGIELGNEMAFRYFPNPVGSRKISLRNLTSFLKEAKKDSNIDLTNYNCVKGLIFEGILRMYYIGNNGSENVQFQVRKSVSYRDFSGSRHNSVYLDNLVNGQNVEVKLENSLENILESVLPQTFALEKEQDDGVPIRTTLVCRTKDPEFAAMYQENVSLEEEAREMGLNEVGRRIQEVMEYVAFEDLLRKDEDEYSALHWAALEAMDSLTESDTLAMKSYARAFDRISDNPCSLTEKYSSLIDIMKSKKMLNDSQITAIFGAKSKKATDNSELRLEIIESNRKQGERRALLEVYNRRFRKDEEELTEEHIAKLSGIPKDELEVLYKEILEEKKQKRSCQARRSKPGIDEVLAFHDRAYERSAQDTIRQHKAAYYLLMQQTVPISRALNTRSGISRDHFNDYPREIETLVEILEREKIYISQGNLRDMLCASIPYLAGSLRDIGRLSKKFYGDTRHPYKILEDLKQLFSEFRESHDKRIEGLVSDKAQSKILELSEKAQKGTFIGSRRETAIVQRAASLLRCDVAAALIEANAAFTEYSRMASELDVFGGTTILRGYLQEVISEAEEYAADVEVDLTKPVSGLFTSQLVKVANFSEYVYKFACGDLNGNLLYLGNRGLFLRSLRPLVYDPDSQVDFVKAALIQASDLQDGPRLLPGDEERTLILKRLDYPLEDLLALALDFQGSNMGKKVNARSRILEDTARKAYELFFERFYETLGKVHNGQAIIMDSVPVSKEAAVELFDRLKENKTLFYPMVSDYLSRKAYNARVLTALSEDLGDEYLGANQIAIEAKDRPLPEFVDYIEDLYKRDEALFRRYLIGDHPSS